ncbi:MAG: stage V sporulation T C-terminal domain-containing protein [Eubacteriales bacterium]|nr:stage V sporulation T C-terminal domain-containing protein [Eubacteriales bacterium]
MGRIDHLGRVVVPISIRRNLRIREGDPLEIFIDKDSGIIFKKYSPLVGLEDFAQMYADSLYKSSGQLTFITDKEAIIAVSGTSKKEFMYKSLGDIVEKVMNERRIFCHNGSVEQCLNFLDDEEGRFSSILIAPIISGSEPVGSVILCSMEPGVEMGEVEIKLAATATEFLGRHISQ